MKFNFKSSGKKISNRNFQLTINQIKSKIIPVGIKTPLSFGDEKDELFKMNTDPIEQIKDNLRNLIQTNKGERLGRYNIGCNLKSLLFERVSLDSEFKNIMSEHIIEQIKIYMPTVQIDNIDIKVLKKDEINNNMLSDIIVSLNFSIPIGRINNKKLDIKLSCGG